MRIAFAVGFGIILLKLIFDIYMGRVQKEEKQMCAVIATFFVECSLEKFCLYSCKGEDLSYN